LPLLDAHAAVIKVAAIDVETLDVSARQRTFTRLRQREWRYTSPFHDREVESKLDEFGIVVDERDAFTRR
ncbi:MAG: putative glycolipid-binding domain-containing protein, partial [Actinomycetota bacterium]